MNNRFPATCRLKKSVDIKAVFARRETVRTKRLIFYRLEKEDQSGAENRFCFTVSRHCGNSVKRNRIKRVLRDIIRRNRLRIPTGYDYVIRANPEGITDKVKQDDFLADIGKYFNWA